jgi:hypothetical protein
MNCLKLVCLLCLITAGAKAQQWDVVFASEFEPGSNYFFVTGHSLTDNPFADYLGAISDSFGIPGSWNQQIGIGSPVRVRTSGHQLPPNNWAGYAQGKNRNAFDMDVIAELASPATIGAGNLYESLLITERHDILDVIRWEYSNSLIRHYHNRLLTGNPAGETYLYQSWLDIDPADPADWMGYESEIKTAWECVANKINLTLSADGLSPAVNVVPAGWALADLLQRILDDEVPGFTGTDLEKIDDLFNDTVHLNEAGIYYVAAFSFAILEKRSPEGGFIPAAVPAATATALQHIAWLNAERYRQAYRPIDMNTCSNTLVNQLCARYFNFTDRPEQVSSCQNWMSNSGLTYNPFNWPDPDLVVWPDP